MSEDFVFSVVRNCELREEKSLLLGCGKSTFRIEVSPGSRLCKYDFCYLCFDIEARKPFAGLICELNISWQDVPIAQLEIGAFGRQSPRIPIKSFKTPSTFNFELRFNAGEGFYNSNFENFAPQHAADVSNFRVDATADELGPRALLIPAARGLSVDLGLVDDYLNTEKYETTLAEIAGALDKAKGFSLIRLGDGEGRVLGYPDHFTDQEVLLQVLHYQFGPESMQLVKLAAQDAWIASSMQFLRGMLIKSIKNADIVGLPPNTHFPEDGDTFGMLGFACATIYGLGVSKNLRKTSFVGTDVFQLGAAKRLFFREIIQKPRAVFLVGPWDLTKELGLSLGRDDFQWIRVPGHHTWGNRSGLGQYPDLFRFVEKRIKDLGCLKGSLFLVGAGLFGKHYCNLIKLQGGVALDVGSVFDSWAKKGLPYAVNNRGININNL